jgi:2-oxoglutarate dehydrogenase E2 component (dihydrolipoamide succinyltransferase)
VNDVVPIGSVIARIRTGVQVAQHQAPAHTPTGSRQSQPAGGFNGQAPAHSHSYSQPLARGQAQNASSRFYSPLVLNIAASEGVPMNELETIPGSGNEGRVTKKDILQYVADRRSGSRPQGGSLSVPGTLRTTEAETAEPRPFVSPVSSDTLTRGPRIDSNPPATYSGNVEIVEMDRMRRLIADHMVRSKHTSPHVTSFSEADVTNLVHWREKVKKEFEKREGTKITFTPLFIEAIVHCIKKYPWLNSSVDGDKIIVKKDINIGMATAMPNGNLIVPVIRNADQLNLVGLARQVNALAENARQNKLRPEDTQGGTFTMTNVGTFGSLMGTPIINQPQVAILAIGAIKKRPVVLESPEGDSIAIRHMMYLSLSYDHRIVDGSLGATFLTAIARELENFPANREF